MHTGGLALYDSHKHKLIKYNTREEGSRKLYNDQVSNIVKDREGRIWIGTFGGGFCRFDEEKGIMEWLTAVEGLSDDNINSIIPGDDGKLWISTGNGISAYDPESRQFTNYMGRSEIPVNEFSMKGGIKLPGDRIYFSGSNGLVSFYPERLIENRFIPPVVLTSFTVNNKPVVPGDPSGLLDKVLDYTQAIDLDYNQNNFSVGYAALNYLYPNQNKYAYMLEGYDTDWNDAGSRKEAFYTNLKPGDYVFRVKGSNNDGLWNTEGSSISLQILPPFWKSSWAYLFYTILILFLGVMTFRSWSKRVKKQHEELLKQYRQQQEKETYQTKINFFTQVAHEIRTPLSLIKMPLESIIQSGDGNEETRKYLTTMNQNTDLLLNLINQLLDFRKTETNEFKLKLRKYNLNELLHNIVSRFAPAAQLKNIALDVQLPVTPYIGCADEEALTKIISNLLSNALKYAHDKIEVTLQTEQEYFEIRVSDNGPGIPRSDRKRIFEIFYQTDNSRGGTGIGLPLAKLLAEKHGGRLYLDEQTQKTTFIIHIPLLQENTQEDDQVKLELLTSPVSDTGKELQTLEGKGSYSILLTEDNTELLSLTAEQLNKYYRILMARNGKEALAILKETNVDLVVSDIMMPEMDGYSLCESIKNNPQYCHIPVILLTAKTTTDDKIKGLQYGSDAYIEKPFSVQHLKTQIDNLLQNRQKLRKLFASSPLVTAETMAISPKDKEFIERLDTEIQKNLQEPTFSIDTLAEIMCMSRSNFYRKIKGISGMSPNDYLKTIRLKMAAELLLQQEYRINEIYELVGFSSSSYFTKCFKEQFGVPPKEFLNNAKNNAGNKSSEIVT